MSLAEYALRDRESTTVSMPFNLYCFKCNIPIQKGEPALKFDAATYTHHNCPALTHKTVAPHKYGENK